MNIKIMYVNCGVKNYMNEDHRSYIRNFCNHPFYGFIGFLVLELFKLINFFFTPFCVRREVRTSHCKGLSLFSWSARLNVPTSHLYKLPVFGLVANGQFAVHNLLYGVKFQNQMLFSQLLISLFEKKKKGLKKVKDVCKT